MKLILLQSGESTGELDLSQGTYTVGRSDDCAIVVDDPSLAETHARLFEDNGMAYVEPIEGETQVNGSPVPARTALSDSDQLSFGNLELTISIPDAPPPLPDTPLANDESVAGDSEGKSVGTSAARIGKGLLGMAKASAREAGRGAKLAGLKAQIEKHRRVNLRNAHLDIGRKAYELELIAEELAEEYAQVRAIQAQIEEKRQGTAVSDDAGVMVKAKAKAISAKMLAEAEILERKLNGVLIDIGQKIMSTIPDCVDLAAETRVAADVVAHIQDLEAQYQAAATDRSARDDVAAAAKGIRDSSIPATTEVRACHTKKPFLRSKLGWVVLAIPVFIVLVFLARHHHSGQGPVSASTVELDATEELEAYAGKEVVVVGKVLTDYTSSGYPKYRWLSFMFTQFGLMIYEDDLPKAWPSNVKGRSVRARGVISRKIGDSLPGRGSGLQMVLEEPSQLQITDASESGGSISRKTGTFGDWVRGMNSVLRDIKRGEMPESVPSTHSLLALDPAFEEALAEAWQPPADQEFMSYEDIRAEKEKRKNALERAAYILLQKQLSILDMPYYLCFGDGKHSYKTTTYEVELSGKGRKPYTSVYSWKVEYDEWSPETGLTLKAIKGDEPDIVDIQYPVAVADGDTVKVYPVAANDAGARRIMAGEGVFVPSRYGSTVLSVKQDGFSKDEPWRSGPVDRVIAERVKNGGVKMAVGVEFTPCVLLLLQWDRPTSRHSKSFKPEHLETLRLISRLCAMPAAPTVFTANGTRMAIPVDEGSLRKAFGVK